MTDTQIQTWMQPISTFIGAAIALLTALVAAFFNHRNSAKRDALTRQRERLENIYELLSDISISTRKEARNLGRKVWDNSLNISFHEHEYKAPFLKVEMLISLYFRNLIPLHEELKDEVVNFITEANHTAICDYSRAEAFHKEEICGYLEKWASCVEEKANSIKAAVSAIAKA